MLEAGDRLEPEALYAVHLAVTRDPLVDLVSWEDRVDDPADPSDAVRARPSWSPDTLLSGNYLGWAFGLRPAAVPCQSAASGPNCRTHRLGPLLRCEFDRERVARVPRVLATVARHGSWRTPTVDRPCRTPSTAGA